VSYLYFSINTHIQSLANSNLSNISNFNHNSLKNELLIMSDNIQKLEFLPKNMTFKNPRWLIEYFESTEVVNDELFDKINTKIKLNNETPEVSIIIPAWNEETNILRCVLSLVNQVTNYNYEIIVVNNNSTDRTAEYLQKLNIKSFNQPIQGCGPSRKLGQEYANAPYILLGDADCVYPKEWVELMISQLKKTRAVAVLGRFTFIGDDQVPRWKLFIYDQIKKPFLAMRQARRPYLNAMGASLGYVKELGIKYKNVMDRKSGSDGVLIMNLMRHGKITKMTHPDSLVWTSYRAFLRDESFLAGAKRRAIRELLIIRDYFFPGNIK